MATDIETWVRRRRGSVWYGHFPRLHVPHLPLSEDLHAAASARASAGLASAEALHLHGERSRRMV